MCLILKLALYINIIDLWKFHDNTVAGTLLKRCDGQTERRTGPLIELVSAKMTQVTTTNSHCVNNVACFFLYFKLWRSLVAESVSWLALCVQGTWLSSCERSWTQCSPGASQIYHIWVVSCYNSPHLCTEYPCFNSQRKSRKPLQWRHNGPDSVSNHQPHHWLLNRLFRRRSKKTFKLRVTGLCAGNSAETGEFPAQMASNEESVSIWWRHHDTYFHSNAWHLGLLSHTFWQSWTDLIINLDVQPEACFLAVFLNSHFSSVGGLSLLTVKTKMRPKCIYAIAMLSLLTPSSKS